MSDLIAFYILFYIFAAYFILIGITVAEYVLSSLGLFKVAKKRGIALAGFAWMPVGNFWVMGKIIDGYAENYPNRFKKWRILIPVSYGVFMGIYSLFYMLYLCLYFNAMGTAIVGSEVDGLFVFILLCLIIVWMFLIIIAATAVTALNYIAMYKIFEETIPKKSVKYFILSIVLPLASGICLLKAAKNLPDPTPFGDIQENAPVDNYSFTEPETLNKAVPETNETISLTEPENVPESNPVSLSNDINPNDLI